MNVALKVVGTLLFGGPLLSYLLGTIMSLISCYNDKNEFNNLFLSIGGKIERKWYFFNSIIAFACLCFLTALCYFLSNWIMFLISIPYFLILFVLFWNNCYKRINAIFDNSKFSLFFTILFFAFSFGIRTVSNYMTSKIINGLLLVELLIWGLLLFMPSEIFKRKKKDNYTVAISILEEYANNFNSNLFDTEIESKIKTFLTKDKKVLNNNKFYNDELMVRGLIAGMIGNYAGDLLESGEFHLYRGVLSPAGKEMLKYYDFAMKEVLKIGGTNPNGEPLTEEYITEQRNILLENIRQVG